MIDSYFSELSFDRSMLRRCKDVRDADTNCFSSLVEIAHLDKKNDFKNSDLSNLDFSNSNLEGYDFSYADLSGSYGINIKFDEYTVFDGANLSNSVFRSHKQTEDFLKINPDAVEILSRLSGADWLSKVEWSRNNLMGNRINKNVAMFISKILHNRARGGLEQAEIFRYIMHHEIDISNASDFMIYSISISPDNAPLILACLDVIRNRNIGYNRAIRGALFQVMERSHLLKKYEITFEIIKFFTRTKEMGEREEFDYVKHFVSKSNKYVQKKYVIFVSKLIGDAYRVATMDPFSGSVFSVTEKINQVKYRQIERNISIIKNNKESLDAIYKRLKKYGIYISAYD